MCDICGGHWWETVIFFLLAVNIWGPVVASILLIFIIYGIIKIIIDRKRHKTINKKFVIFWISSIILLILIILISNFILEFLVGSNIIDVFKMYFKVSILHQYKN